MNRFALCVAAHVAIATFPACAPENAPPPLTPNEHPRQEVQPAAPRTVPTVPQPAPQVEETEDPFAGVTPVRFDIRVTRTLIDALPLDTHDINLARINRFVDLYIAVAASLPNERRMSLASVIRDLRKYQRGLTQHTRLAGQNSFSMDNLDEHAAEDWAKLPTFRNTLPILSFLKSIVQDVGQIVSHLNTECTVFREESGCSLNEDQRNKLAQQLQGDSKMNYNLTQLTSTAKHVELMLESRMRKDR